MGTLEMVNCYTETRATDAALPLYIVSLNGSSWDDIYMSHVLTPNSDKIRCEWCGQRNDTNRDDCKFCGAPI